MRKKRKNSKRTKTYQKIISILIIFVAFTYGLYENEIKTTFSLPTETTFKENNNNLTITYLDVGQADAILIQNQNQNMLIDAGNNEDGELLVQYFKEKNITQFNYLIGTHPHEDHIGGLDDIINAFQINKIYLPDAITTTKTFLDVLDAIERKKLSFTVPEIDETFCLGEAIITVIYTGTDTKNLNNASIILKLTFKNTSFLFTGDTTNTIESLILEKDIQADVLKIGHHGSKTSTSKEFLNKVNPKYAILSVGKNNNYNHPHSTTLNKLKEKNIKTYRTDQSGSIIIQSDGEHFQISTKFTNTNGDKK